MNHVDLPKSDEAFNRVLPRLNLGRRGFLGAGLASAAVLQGCASTHDKTTAAPLVTGGSAPRTHVLECSQKTVRVGLLDPAAEAAVTIDSGDIVHYPNTWLNWANEPKYGMNFADREPIRRRYPSGPYSNIGPVFVRGADYYAQGPETT